MRGERCGYIVCLVLVAWIPLQRPAQAQIPNEFTNLQLLPKEIERGELVNTMRGWAVGLGVRCSHCHVGPDDLQGMDFASDEKATKRAAREMLKMARAINGQYLAALPESAEARRSVTCFTCHRGQPYPPRPLTDILAEAASEGGVESGLDRYRTLRAEHYGEGLYDFSPGALNQLAQRLAEGGDGPGAIEVLRFNAAEHPESADAHAGLGVGLLQAGDRDGAKASFERAVELDPENRTAAFGLQRLAATTESEP